MSLATPSTALKDKKKFNLVKKELTNNDLIKINFKFPDQTTKTVRTKPNLNLLEIAHSNKIPVEGACEGGLACTTCHVILDNTDYKKFDEPSEKEEDLLCESPCVTDTSRLACQLEVKKIHDGLNVLLPKYTKNFYVDGFVPEAH